jgi:pentatricopeptide repeat protein
MVCSACRKANQPDKALEIFAEMKASGAVGDVYTYSALISVYESMGDWENALATYSEMLELNIAPSIVTYSSLIRYFPPIIILMKKNLFMPVN